MTNIAAAPTAAPDRVAVASQWQLTWWAFKKHRLAMVGLWVVAFFYLIALIPGGPWAGLELTFTGAPPPAGATVAVELSRISEDHATGAMRVSGVEILRVDRASRTPGLVPSPAAAPALLAAPAHSASAPVAAVLHLETFTLNIDDPEQRTYLRVGIDLGLDHDPKDQKGPAASPTAVLRDTILNVLMATKPQDVTTIEGKRKLKEQILAALRERVPDLGVREIYFTEFLVQR